MRRQLNVGETLGETFTAYGAHAGVLLPLAFWLFLAVAIVDGVAGSSFALVAAGIVISNVAGTVYKGMVVGLVRDAREGRRESSVGELFGYVVPVLVPLLLAGLLAGIGIFVGMLLLLVPGLFLLTIWSVIAPAIVIERKRRLRVLRPLPPARPRPRLAGPRGARRRAPDHRGAPASSSRRSPRGSPTARSCGSSSAPSR